MPIIMMFVLFVYILPAHAQTIPACDPDAPLANGAPSTSPEGRYTVYVDCYAPDATAYTVYAYDAETDGTYALGTTAPDLDTETVIIARWLDDAQVALRSQTGGGTYNWRSVYIADASMSASLREVARDYVARPAYRDNPPRYEWVVEDGVNASIAVYRYDVQSGETDTLFTGDCLPRDDMGTALSCHMVTVNTNESFTDGSATRMILNVGDSAREIKTVEIRALPSGDLLHTVEALGGGYGDWLSDDTAAVFNLAFDFESGGFGGVFLRFGADGTLIDDEPFTLANGDEMTLRPAWLEEDDK